MLYDAPGLSISSAVKRTSGIRDSVSLPAISQDWDSGFGIDDEEPVLVCHRNPLLMAIAALANDIEVCWVIRGRSSLGCTTEIVAFLAGRNDNPGHGTDATGKVETEEAENETDQYDEQGDKTRAAHILVSLMFMSFLDELRRFESRD